MSTIGGVLGPCLYTKCIQTVAVSRSLYRKLWLEENVCMLLLLLLLLYFVTLG